MGVTMSEKGQGDNNLRSFFFFSFFIEVIPMAR